MRRNPGRMRRAVSLATSLVVVVAIVAQPPVATAAEGPSVYYGAFNGGALGDNLNALTEFEAVAKKPVAIANFFNSWGGANPKFPSQAVQNIRNHGSIPMITWEPWDTTAGVNQANYQLRDIADGRHDTYITEWAAAAKSSASPIFLRFMHEMNGTWYPWARTVNGNTANDYIDAWRHVHNIFDGLGVTNVTWVWCVNTEYPGSSSIGPAYPGDNYVDWVAIDGYNRGTVNGNQNVSFAAMIKPSYDQLQSIAGGKPVMIAENGTVEQGSDKPAWFRNALKYDLKVTFPRVKAYVYFNLNKNYDNRITSTEASRYAFAESVGLSYYAGNA